MLCTKALYCTPELSYVLGYYRICMRRVAPMTLVPFVVAAVTSGTALAVTTTAPTALGDSILFMEFSDNPTIISIVGVLLVEDAVAVSSTLIMPSVVPVTLLVVMLRCKGNTLLVLGVFLLGLWGRYLR
jgi:hypothetical protein